jgi:type III secretion protein T
MLDFDTLRSWLGLSRSIEEGLWLFALILCRLIPVFFLIPFLGSNSVPMRARITLTLVLSFFVFYLIEPSLHVSFAQSSGIFIGALMVKELLLGTAFGLTALALFLAIEAAGKVVDNQRGGANAQLFNPALGQVTLFGLFYFWMAMSLFLSLRGHVAFLEVLLGSFVDLPVDVMPQLQGGLDQLAYEIIAITGNVLVVAIGLSSPVIVAILLADLVLGLANKMAPQINVFELGFAIKGYLGPLMVYVSLWVISGQIQSLSLAMLDSLRRIILLFGR